MASRFVYECGCAECGELFYPCDEHTDTNWKQAAQTWKRERDIQVAEVERLTRERDAHMAAAAREQTFRVNTEHERNLAREERDIANRRALAIEAEVARLRADLGHRCGAWAPNGEGERDANT